jgi:hypothetical protein
MSDDSEVAGEVSATKKAATKKAATKKAATKKAATKKAATKKATTKKVATKKATTKKVAVRVERPFPRRPLEEAVLVPLALKEQYGGNPRPPADVATALGYLGSTSNAFFYQAAASRDFGFTHGTRDATQIELDDRGRRYVYAPSVDLERQVLREAFMSVEIFRGLFEYYKGPNLPEKRYLSNVLESQFHLNPEVHDEFIELYKHNTTFAGLNADDVPPGALEAGNPLSLGLRPDVVTVDEPDGDTTGKPNCFVIMPFAERTDDYRPGFFGEVLKSIIGPAGKQAGFSVSTANRDGSDVIQSTIVNRLLDDDLVIADLTEHNPNVLFELGMRMAFDKPTVLIKAKGTRAIFDVDNMLRVFEYEPSLWQSTVEIDVPNLAQFIRATWINRSEENTYLRILKRSAATN